MNRLLQFIILLLMSAAGGEISNPFGWNYPFDHILKPTPKICLVLLGIALVVFCPPAMANSFAQDFLDGKLQAKGLELPLYSKDSETPALLLAIDNIYPGYERKGFFRIGILRLGVMDGVTFRLIDREAMAQVFAQLDLMLSPGDSKHLELRNVLFRSHGTGMNFLHCGMVHVRQGKWEMLDGVTWYAGRDQILSRRATLQVTGTNSGLLEMASNPPFTTNLFLSIPTPVPNPKQHEN